MQARSVVPVFPCTWPRSEGRRLLSVPLTPATASEPMKALRIDGSFARRSDHADERVSREAIEAREPRAVHHADAGDGDPGVAHRGDDEPAAACRRARLPRRRGELLEEHLRVEVVALVVHVADRPARAGRRRRRRATRRVPGATPSPGRPPTETPWRTRASRKARAASSGGESAGQPRARSTTSADSGGASPPVKYDFQPAAPRFVS